MKIAIDIRPIGRQRTGDEAYTLNLIKNLAKIDLENDYFLLTNTKNKKFLETIEQIIAGDSNKLPENFRIIPIVPANKFLWTFFAMPAWARKNKPDILHVQYIVPPIFPGKTKIVTTIHDVSFDAFPKLIGKIDLFFLKILIPLSIKKADKVISISKFTKNEIIKYHKVDPNKIKVVLNGGAPEVFFQKFSDSFKNEIISKYKLPEKFFFHIGTLQPRKNIPFLLGSFVEFIDRYSSRDGRLKNIELILTGSLNQHNADKRIQNKLETIKQSRPNIYSKIRFLGYVENEELPIILKRAQAAIITSLYEGFGLPVIETMAAGAPLVCSDNSSLPEVAGDAACYYKQNDEKDLAKILFQVIMDKELQRDLQIKGEERAMVFNWKKCAEKTLKVYQKTAKQK